MNTYNQNEVECTKITTPFNRRKNGTSVREDEVIRNTNNDVGSVAREETTVRLRTF